MPGLPTGTVTFLFTDLEGSTRLWEAQPAAMQGALARHDAILRDAVEQHGGSLVKSTGDGIHAAFSTADAAIAAAAAAQRRLGVEPWPEPVSIRVRMGLHTGAAEVRDGDYYGSSVNRAARLMSVAHGGQVVCSQTTADLVREELPATEQLLDLGVHRLRDLGTPERVFQLVDDGLDREFPPLQSLDALPGNLPLQLTSFIGREDELAAAIDALGAARLVTLTGVGGVGKTRLALHVAADLLLECPDGVWFCELAAASDTDSMVQLVATTIGASARPGMPLTASIVEFLRYRTVILVLDNCEHVLEAAADFAAAVLRDCPGVRVLATSREALGIMGEQVLRVRSLPLPDSAADAETLEANDAVRLFAERAAATGAFVLSPSNVVAVAEICRRLDGIPLAVELAAARVVTMQPAEIAERLDERFRLLTGRRHGAMERHQTLRATVDWSYSLLSGQERLLFARLSVFPGPFDTAAAQAVAVGDGLDEWDVVDALEALVAKSLVIVDEGEHATTRYQLLETLRQYGRERLDEVGGADGWRRRHAEHYAEFAEAAGPGLWGADELRWRPRVDLETDNLRAAMGWSLDCRDPADRSIGVRIVAALTVEANTGRSCNIGEWAERALPDAERDTPGRRSAILTAAAWGALNRGDLEEAASRAHAALRDGIAPDWLGPVGAYMLVGLVEIMNGRPDDAIRVAQDGRQVFAALDRPTDLSVMTTAVAAFSEVAGGDETATQLADEGIRLARASGNATAIAASLLPVVVARWRDDPDLAIALADESTALIAAGASGVAHGYLLAMRAQLFSRAGQHRDALTTLLEALSFSHDKGDQPMLLLVIDRGIQVLVEAGAPTTAAVFAGVILEGSLGGLSTLPSAELPDRDRAVADSRAALGDAAFEAALARGAAMTYDQLVGYSLAELDRLGRDLGEAR